MKLPPSLAALALLPASALFCFAQTADDPAERLALLPQPGVEPIHRITFEEYEAALKYWASAATTNLFQ